MKKLISLLLVLVLTMGLLTGLTMAADMPAEVTEAEAGVKVTNDKGAVHYFDTLSSAVVDWVRQDLEGAKTITVLKDLTLDDSTGAMDSRYLNFQATSALWFGGNGHKFPVTIDFGGKTVTYEGTANFVYIERWGITMKNGTLIYKGTSDKGRNAITIGTTKGPTATSSGSALWAPQMKIQNMTILSDCTKGGGVLANYVYGTDAKIEDCTFWAAKGHALNLSTTSQEGLTETQVAYVGDLVANFEVQNSVLGSANNYAVDCVNEAYTVTVEDTMVVSNNKDSNEAMDAGTKNIVDTQGQDLVPTENWTAEIAGQSVTGNAYAIGEAPGAAPAAPPFTDVKEGDWFYTFVAEMYNQGIINGMTETTFVPNGTLTYGQALKLMVVGMGAGEQPAGAHWASGYMDYAKKEGWIAADVDLNGPVSRLAFCQIAAKAKNLTEVGENPFKDTTDASVLALVKAGVISGMSADTFVPDQTLTRAQIAKILSLLLNL